MTTDWEDEDLVNSYAAAADDDDKHWYENEVNARSIFALLPEPDKRFKVLDFGCGPGSFTAQLGSKYAAQGCDASERMVRKAREHSPDLEFFHWDGLSRSPEGFGAYDAVISKLTFEFIEDLPAVARNLRSVLVPEGLLMFSVQHPVLAIVMHPETDISYWGASQFYVHIGMTGAHVSKVHRSFSDYMNVFIENGFLLKGVDEPRIPKALGEKHGARDIDLAIPKRLNVLLQVK